MLFKVAPEKFRYADNICKTVPRILACISSFLFPYSHLIRLIQKHANYFVAYHKLFLVVVNDQVGMYLICHCNMIKKTKLNINGVPSSLLAFYEYRLNTHDTLRNALLRFYLR
jgi:hypothetical protein